MPVSVVDIDLTAEIAALPQPTFTDVAVIGTATAAPPNAAFGEVNRYGSAAEVANDYGDGSDVHESSKELEGRGVEEWMVVVLEAVEETETIDDGNAVSTTPVLGDPVPTAAARDVVFSTESPPAAPDNGEVAINTDTGEVTTDDGTSADITYYHVDWTRLDRLGELGVDRLHRANTQAGREHIGTYDELVTWAGGNRAGVVLPIKDGTTFADTDAAMTAAHETAGYVSSGDVLPFIAMESSGDPGGEVLGQLATNDPWFDPFFDGDGYGFANDYFEDAVVGDPSTAETFEGGDVNGDGPVNVVINVGGTTVLSNSVSTAGASSNYQYFDVSMTESYAAEIVENALTSLRLREDRVPFTQDGRTMISSTIKSAFAGDVGGADDPFAEVSVNVPSIDQLTDDEKANRVWSGISIEGTLSGNVHEFGLEMTVTV
jgi:hypothetical protein